MIVVSEKASIDGSSVTDFKKNDGLCRILTGDLRHVKAGSLALAPLFLDRSEVFLDTLRITLGQGMQVLHRAPTDKCAFEVLPALRTCGVAVSLGSCNQFLHGG